MSRRRISLAAFVVVGLVVAVLLVVFVSPHADANPDGLAKVSAETGIDRSELPSAADGSPLAGYAVKSVDHDAIGKGLAGVIGIVVTFVVVAGALWLVRRRRTTPTAETPVA
jgi:cobalt/nickel transport protein